mgnify:CR=1 FL=1
MILLLSELTWPNTDKQSRVHLSIPSTRWVNPSDCVDMDCDALRQALVKDLDGTLTGYAKGSVISMAEYEWGGNPSFGLGKPCIQVYCSCCAN